MEERISFSQVEEDLQEYEIEFIDRIVDKKHESMINKFAPFNKNEPPEIDGKRFLKYFQAEKNSNDRILLNEVTLLSLRDFTRRNIETLIEENESIKNTQIKKNYWWSIGASITQAIEIAHKK